MNLERIKEKVLEVAPDLIQLIVLFGSQARKDTRPLSDIDIAISLPDLDKHQRFKVRLGVISQFAGPEQSIDVVIIEEANWSLKYRIARDGKVLFDRTGNNFAALAEAVMKYYPDYKIYEEQYFRYAQGGS